MNELEVHREWQRRYFNWHPIYGVPQEAAFSLRQLGVNYHSSHHNNTMIGMWLDDQIQEIETEIRAFQEFRGSLGKVK